MMVSSMACPSSVTMRTSERPRGWLRSLMNERSTTRACPCLLRRREAVVQRPVEVANGALVPAELDELVGAGVQPPLHGRRHGVVLDGGQFAHAPRSRRVGRRRRALVALLHGVG